MIILDKIIHSIEKTIYYILSFLLLLFVAYEVIDLVTLFYDEVTKASIENKSIALTGVPLFFNIIITLEIMETFKGNNENILQKVKLILLIALTAISRKVITMDVKHVGFETEIGISILILSICIGYFILNNLRLQKRNKQK